MLVFIVIIKKNKKILAIIFKIKYNYNGGRI